MTGNFNPRLDAINSKINTVVGLKQYRQVKKAMEEFDSKLHQEMGNHSKINRQIK